MVFFKCKMCGGSLEVDQTSNLGTCQYCGSTVTLPKLDDEKKINLYDRANHFRRNDEFDKAMALYETILTEYGPEAEAYWSIILCKYGVEYVEDPQTHKRMITCNRTQLFSIFADEDYKEAIRQAEGEAKELYQQEAEIIDKIQKEILEIARKEEPFDIFICYKETDEAGNRTPDSVIAQDLYDDLTEEGFKVFFARITLENQLGVSYEPYIFAALNSAKVMVAIGTKRDYFNAAWVKNEWSRYLGMIKAGADKVLIPAYKDMAPYDLPEEFSHLQGQDMAKLGFMQDLVRGIKKIIGAQTQERNAKKTADVSGASTEGLMKRACIFLEDGNWEQANQYSEKILDIEPENARAYVIKLMSELHVGSEERLCDVGYPLEEYDSFKKAVRFADDVYRAKLKECNDSIVQRLEQQKNEKIYQQALLAWEGKPVVQALEEAAEAFESVCFYKDAAALAVQCRQKAEETRKKQVYYQAVAQMQKGEIQSLRAGVELLRSVLGYEDADRQLEQGLKKIKELEQEAQRYRQEELKRKQKLQKYAMIITFGIIFVVLFIVILESVVLPAARYQQANTLYQQQSYIPAAAVFERLKNHKNSAAMYKECLYQEGTKRYQEKRYFEAMDVFHDAGNYKDSVACYRACDKAIREYENYIATGLSHTVALRSDRTVIATGNNQYGQCAVEEWKDIVSVKAYRNNTAGLRADGTVVVIGENQYGQCNVETWSNVIQIELGTNQIVGLCSDGTVVASGNNENGQCNVEDWRDITAISVGESFVVGLCGDGTAVAAGSNKYGQCNVEGWKDIISVDAADSHVAGLRLDGTVVAAGDNSDGQCNVENWKNVLSISAGDTSPIP